MAGGGEVHLGFRGIERVLRDDFAAIEVLLQALLALRLGEISFGVLDIGFGLGDGREHVGVVQRGDDLAGFDNAALFHQQPRDAALDLRRDHGLLARDQIAGGGEDRRTGIGAARVLDARGDGFNLHRA